MVNGKKFITVPAIWCGIVAVIAGKMRSYPGVCLAGPAAWVLAGGLVLVMYFYIMNVHMKKVFGTNGKD